MKFPVLRKLAARVKAAVGVTDVSPLVSTGGWFSLIRESFAGAWQQGVTVESRESLLAFSTVYACVDLICADIAKLRIKLVEMREGVWLEIANPAFSPVLRRPNSYQTRQQFLTAWMVSKLLWGNTYVLKQRDNRNVVTALHVLDPRAVQLKITADGGVYYVLSTDYLARTGPVTVPASEMIHDRAMCPFHPLIGVGPIYAAGVSATQGRKIQTNSTKFFEQMSRPGGHLTTDGDIPDETADRLKRDFEERFGGENMGRLLVTGSGLKFEPLAMPAEQAQLIEQLGWTGEDVCRPFHVPAYKVGLGDPPTFNNIGQLNQDYYSQCLQAHIEGIESLLDAGLGLEGTNMGTELDIDALLRMDPVARMEVEDKAVKASIHSIDEARRVDNKPPLPGGIGKLPWKQQQEYPIDVLAMRTGVTPSGGAAPEPAAPAAPSPSAAPATTPAAPAPAKSDGQAEPTEDFERFMKGLVDRAIAEDFEHV